MIAIVAFLCVDACSDNILQNGSFEEGLKGWQVQKGKEVIVEVDPSVAEEGKVSLYLVSRPGFEGRLKVWQTVKELTPLRWYRLSGWLKWKTIEGFSIGGRFVFARERKAKITTSSGIALRRALPGDLEEGGWFHFGRLFKFPEGAEGVTISFEPRFGENNEVWLDDLRVEEVSIPKGYERLFDLVTCPGKEFVLDRPGIEGETVIRLEKPVRETFRLIFKPGLGDFIVDLVDRSGKVVPMLMVRTSLHYLYRFDGQRWRKIPTTMEPPGAAMTAWCDLKAGKKGAFLLTVFALTSGLTGPFDLAEPIEELVAVRVRPVQPSKPFLVRELWLEAPCYTSTEIDGLIARRVENWLKLSGNLPSGGGGNPEEDLKVLPPDLKVTEPLRMPRWFLQATMYGSHLPFRRLKELIPLLKLMGFSLLHLGQVNVPDRLGFGSPFAPQSHRSIPPGRGTSRDLKDLVKEAHRHGIRVTIWFVPNQTGQSHRWVYEHPEYYWRHSGIFQSANGDTMFLNYSNPDVWRAMAKEMVWWLEEFDLDGLGADMGALITPAFWRYFKRQMQKVKPDCVLLSETHEGFVEPWGVDLRWFWSTIWHGEVLYRHPERASKTVKSWLKSLTSRPKKFVPEGYDHPNLLFVHFAPFYEFNIRRAERLGILDFMKALVVLEATLPGVVPGVSGSELFTLYDDPKYPFRLMSRCLRLRRRFPCLWSWDYRDCETDVGYVAAYVREAGKERAIVIVNFAKETKTVTVTLPEGMSAKEVSGWMDWVWGKREFVEAVGEREIRLTLKGYEGVVLMPKDEKVWQAMEAEEKEIRRLLRKFFVAESRR